MRYFEVLNEAPLADFGVHGDTYNAGSYSASDVKVFHNQKWLHKLNSHFSRTPYNFNVYLYNAPNGDFYPYKTTTGERDVVNSMKSIRSLYDGRVDGQQLHNLETMLSIKLPPANGFIGFMMFDNEGDEKVGLTPWILVHRLVHGLMASGGRDASSSLDYARIEMINQALNFARFINRNFRSTEVYKFKSAKHDKISKAREGEFAIELMTQFIVQGKITLNLQEPVYPIHGKKVYLKDWGHLDDELAWDDYTDSKIYDRLLKMYLAILPKIDIENSDRYYVETVRDKLKAKFIGNQPPAPRRNNSYNVYTIDDGELIASTGNPERYNDKTKYRVEMYYEATPANIKKAEDKIAAWEKKKDDIDKEFNDIFYAFNASFKSYHKHQQNYAKALSELEALNSAFDRYLKKCVGHYFVLSGRS
jgi:hypothetical protein